MKCIQLNSPLLPLHSQLKHQQQLRHAKQLWPTTNKPTRTIQLIQHSASLSPLQTKALPHSILFAATSPPKTGDISVFIQTSGLLLFVYWIANFVVPDLISKYYGFDKVSEDQKDDGVKNTEDKSQVSSRPKKRGFNSTKT
ncbi:Glutathione transport system permease gsiD [Quillaja saponaria]|uniref:Glutathione transport system permease gsiD n=1 Tax=Quillaja saponaria TaxID=32244 RepID=A0AAD7LTF3_QUISA|nr:Glutathione transport system permease gsiD [Quillaja saponaria]